MQDVSGQVTRVTSGAVGLEAATAAMRAQDGMRGTLFDFRTVKGTAYAKKIGGLFVHMDVSDPASVAAGTVRITKTHRLPRDLVNCAGSHGAAKTSARGKAFAFRAFQKRIADRVAGLALRAGSRPIALWPARGRAELVAPIAHNPMLNGKVVPLTAQSAWRCADRRGI